MVAVMGAGPSIPGKAVEVTSSLEVYYVIDRTGSMGAEDWTGDNPRIDGVRSDVGILMNSLTGSRFSILSWDSNVHVGMPLTTDASAVQSYMATFTQELSSSSQGSSPHRPAQELAKLLKKNKERHPNNIARSSSSPMVRRRTRATGRLLPWGPNRIGTPSSPTSTAAWSSATALRKAAR